MAKGAYIGVGGKARKVRKIYIGVGGVAHKVKKAYIGVGGKARLCFSSGSLSYHGKAAAMSHKRSAFAGASSPDFAVFCCGKVGSGYSPRADKYDKSLTMTYVDGLRAGSDLAGAMVSQGYVSSGGTTYKYCAIFGGGYNGNYFDDVVHFNSSMTITDLEPLSYGKRYLASANSDLVIFAGGQLSDGSASDSTDGYNYDGTKTSYLNWLPTNGAYSMCAVTGKKHAIFAGGEDDSGYSKKVCTNRKGWSNWEFADDLGVARAKAAGAAVGDYVLIAGGYNGSALATVDAYNSSLTRSVPTELSIARYSFAGVSVGDVALFGGGNMRIATVNLVEMYDASLTRTVVEPSLSNSVYDLAAASVGPYGLFAGGYNGGADLDVVDVYKYD